MLEVTVRTVKCSKCGKIQQVASTTDCDYHLQACEHTQDEDNKYELLNTDFRVIESLKELNKDWVDEEEWIDEE